MNKSELLSFLHEIGASPRKALSQHFLIDQNIVSNIVQLADIRPGDQVLEIGPGPGAITKELLAAGATVLAIEMDRLFAEHLSRLQTPDKRLRVHCADFLQFPLGLKPLWKVVSNLPYQITAPIVEKLCNHSSLFDSFTFVAQKEVGEKIRAQPRTKEYSSFTIFLQFYTSYGGNFPISRGCFYPKPNVESIACRLNIRSLPDIDPAIFFPVLRKAFQQRRKMITSSLKELHADIGSVLLSIGLSQKARPEELSLDEWVAFVKKLKTIN